uniref:Sodium:calcium symporter n=1 Tax=Thermodesulfobacterium geofontis TaxID=1295609 RepID=A0A7V5XI91_9BACT
MRKRETWATQIGLILAAAGNAIGLGNILRFPSKVALYGGGAFMLPYFISLFLLGFPLMILEWVIGRYAGSKGHGSMVGIMGVFFNQSSLPRIIGSLGVAIPFLIVCYYIYIESWTLGFAFLSLFKKLPQSIEYTDPNLALIPFLKFYKEYTQPSFLAIFFLLITLVLNWYILKRGIVNGIELTAKIGIPLLFLMGIFLSIVSLSINNWKGVEGLYFIFKPNFSRLTDPQVWVEASGQVFFTLSLAMGAIATYASYVKKNEDVVKMGLYTAGLNELVEIGIGASIAIPAAFAIFGAASIPQLAQEGTFRLGFMSMPAILASLPFGYIFSFIWFLLLFIAAFTSSLALIQPLVALFEDELKISHNLAVNLSMVMVTLGAFLSAFVPDFLDELDFWAGAVFLILFAFIEILVFVWLFGVDNFYKELTRNTFLKIPKVMVYGFYGVSLIFIGILFYFWILIKLPQYFQNITWNIVIARSFIIGTIFTLGLLAIKSK